MNSFVSGIYELVKVVETESPFVNDFDRWLAQSIKNRQTGANLEQTLEAWRIFNSTWFGMAVKTLTFEMDQYDE